jgi:hypothetical protein
LELDTTLPQGRSLDFELGLICLDQRSDDEACINITACDLENSIYHCIFTSSFSSPVWIQVLMSEGGGGFFCDGKCE